jgi:hypothetical protein
MRPRPYLECGELNEPRKTLFGSKRPESTYAGGQPPRWLIRKLADHAHERLLALLR